MDQRSAAILELLHRLPAKTVAATMRNPRSSADRVFRGPTLHEYGVAAGLLTAKLGHAPLASSYFLVTAEDGARSAVAFAEASMDPPAKDVILAYEQDGEPIRNGVRLVITGDDLAGRSIGGVVSVEAKTVDAVPAAGGSLELAGLLDRPGPVDLAHPPGGALIEVETVPAVGSGGRAIPARRYRGVRLYALLEAAGIRLDPDQHEDFLGKVVVVSSAGGMAAVIAGGEIEPRFMAGDVVIVAFDAGDPQDAGAPRLVVPFDRRPARWLKDVTRIELRQA